MVQLEKLLGVPVELIAIHQKMPQASASATPIPDEKENGDGMSEIVKTVMVDGVRIDIKKRETGLFYATSPDIKGLLVAEYTIKKLKAAIPAAIADLRRAEEEAAESKKVTK